ncbi:MAG: M50 family metallopeptidase [Actinomycetota bacterium]|nr:M50 family metallopeptidase [Actinomycetota bacterium]
MLSTILYVFLGIIVIALMILIHEGAHFLVAKAVGIKVDNFALGFGPEIVGTTRGETRYSINWILAGGYVKICGMNPDEEVKKEDLPRSYRNASYWKRAAVVFAGSFSHVLVALILFYLIFWPIGFPVLTGRIYKVEKLFELPDKSKVTSPGYICGLKKGDLITKVNNVQIKEWSDLSRELSNNPGKEVTLVVKRGDTTLEKVVTLLDVDGAGKLGIQADINDTFIRRSNPIKAFQESAVLIGRLSVGFVKGLGSLFSLENLKILAGVSQRTQESPRSIIGAGQLAVQAARRGVSDFLFIIGQIFLFIAIFNLIPLLPFDGGHIVIIIFEKLFHREIDLKRLMPIAWAVIVVLTLVAIRLAFLDIFKPIPSP